MSEMFSEGDNSLAARGDHIWFWRNRYAGVGAAEGAIRATKEKVRSLSL